MRIILVFCEEVFTLSDNGTFPRSPPMSADFRYMKCPRQTWFLVYTIPPDLRGHARFMTANGRPMDKITESLETKDPDKARERRNERIVYWDRQFRILRHGLSEDDIREAAVETYRAALKEKAALEAHEKAQRDAALAYSGRTREEVDTEMDAYRRERYLTDLDHAIKIRAAHEIKEFCKQNHCALEPGTEAYRNLGIRILEAKVAAGIPHAFLPLPDGRTIFGWEEPLPKIEAPATLEPKPITAPPLPKKSAETFAEAAAVYIKTELAEDVELATVEEYQRKADAFTHKDKPLRSIGRGMAADFLDGLTSGDRPLSKRTRNL